MEKDSNTLSEEELAKKAKMKKVSRIIAGVFFVFFAIQLLVMFAG